MWGLAYLAVFLSGFLLCLVLTPFFRRLAIASGIIDQPAARKVHASPTPLLGGAAVFLSFCLVVLGFLALFFLAGPRLPGEIARHLPGVSGIMSRLAILLGGGALIFLFGLVDDRRGVPAWVKLLVQAAIAALLFRAGLRVTLFIGVQAVSFLLTLGWIILITNSFNLLDNMDGLCSGTALVAAFLFFVHAAVGGALFIATMMAAFMGPVLAFLVHNRPPARIFLGEAGSTFLGFFLASAAVLATFYSPGDPSRLPVLAPLLVLAVPIYDTLSVAFIRVREGRSVFTPGRDHFSHRLVAAGLSPRSAVALIHLLALGLGLPALVLRHLPAEAGFFLLSQAVILLAVISLLSKVPAKCPPKS